jgi:hypothetical protein
MFKDQLVTIIHSNNIIHQHNKVNKDNIYNQNKWYLVRIKYFNHKIKVNSYHNRNININKHSKIKLYKIK